MKPTSEALSIWTNDRGYSVLGNVKKMWKLSDAADTCLLRGRPLTMPVHTPTTLQNKHYQVSGSARYNSKRNPKNVRQ